MIELNKIDMRILALILDNQRWEIDDVICYVKDRIDVDVMVVLQKIFYVVILS